VLQEWLAIRASRPPQPRIAQGSDLAIARDRHGNAMAAIRRARVEVPRATLCGEFPLDEVRRLYADRADCETPCAAAIEARGATGVIRTDDADAVLVAARNEWP
jgi:hypothetical protein